MSFLEPWRLLLMIGLIGVIAAYLVMQWRRSRYAARFTNLALLEKVVPLRPGWRRHVPAGAFLLMAFLLIMGIARPTAAARVPKEQATVMIAVDVSDSMRATDVAPDRLTAARDAARSFLDSLPERFNVGLVAFDGRARVTTPPTTDRAALEAGLDTLRLGPRTAIGEGVFVSLDAISGFGAQFGEAAPPSRIVLLSDGTNTEGRSPEEAAARAAEVRVPVSTIAYGTAEGFIELNGQRIPVPVDGPALEQLAQATGGQFYEAASGSELEQVYADIGSSVGYRTERREIWMWFVGAGLVCACVAAAGSLLWFSRIP
jgi:Ca-activated chloride channel family protein